jgi:hypothetical protein
MRNLALADVGPDDLRAMLAENETLFVEHKGNIDRDAFQVAKAVCSFANVLGGWVLIGVTEGEPNAGLPGGWEPSAPHAIVDRVRQALADNRVDPIPAFAATVIDHEETGRPVGVVRVYESSDTPHVMGNGQVFVRSVAQDRDLRRVYRPGGVETQAALFELAARGRIGVDAARRGLSPHVAPLAASVIGISSDGREIYARDGTVGLRAVPVTRGRLPDWTVSEAAHEALKTAVAVLAARADGVMTGDPAASGLMVRTRSTDFFAGGNAPERDGVATVATDQAGLVVAAMAFGLWEPPKEISRLTLNGLRDLVFRPLLDAAVSVLEAAEAYGRVLLETRIGHLARVIELDDVGGTKALPPNLPLGAELTLPRSSELDEIEAIADQWRSDAGRAAGYMTLR